MFELDDDILAVAEEGFDDLITSFGKTCRLVYPPVYEDCPYCAENAGRHGGPMPDHQGVCSLCGGEGKRPTEVTRDIKMTIDWGGTFGVNNRVWSAALNDPLRMGDTLIQTRGFATELARVKQCQEMIVIEANHPMMSWKFTLANDPYDYHGICKGRYFVAFWRRGG